MHGTVIDVRELTPRMVRVVLGGGGLDQFTPTAYTDHYINILFVPADAPYVVPFDLDEARSHSRPHRPVGRRYTIRAWDPTTRQLTIDFVVHGDVGTAGRWAANAQLGDRLQFLGPSGGYAPDPEADWHLLAGDESAIPAIAASLEALPPGSRAVAVLLVDGPDHELPLACEGDLDLRWVHRDDDPGNHGLLPATVEALPFPSGQVHAFVHGEAGETRAIRRHLLGDRAIDPARTSISPYWRRDHSDEQWREVKGSWLAEVARDV